MTNIITNSMRFFDEPHEKFISNMLLLIVFWFVYYSIYTSDKSSMLINKDALHSLNGEPGIFDFAWFATITQLGITFGDMVPKSPACKLAVMSQAIMFWYIALSS